MQTPKANDLNKPTKKTGAPVKPKKAEPAKEAETGQTEVEPAKEVAQKPEKEAAKPARKVTTKDGKEKYLVSEEYYQNNKSKLKLVE